MMIYGYEWSQDTGYCYCVDIDGDSIYIGTDNGVLVFCDGAFRWLNNDEAGISDASSPQNYATVMTVKSFFMRCFNIAYFPVPITFETSSIMPLPPIIRGILPSHFSIMSSCTIMGEREAAMVRL